MDAAYWRDYRAQHRDRINDQTRARRATSGRSRGDRTLEYTKRRARTSPPASEPAPRFADHPLLDQARAVAGPRTGSLTTLYDDRYDDMVMDIVVALLERRCPYAARKAFRTAQINWRTRVVQVLDGFEPYDGRLIPQGVVADL
ncbi:MAG: hypothetical protein ACOYB2_11170 [Limnohabitans sp.]